jgi:hypothetical protein
MLHRVVVLHEYSGILERRRIRKLFRLAGATGFTEQAFQNSFKRRRRCGQETSPDLDRSDAATRLSLPAHLAFGTPKAFSRSDR